MNDDVSSAHQFVGHDSSAIHDTPSQDSSRGMKSCVVIHAHSHDRSLDGNNKGLQVATFCKTPVAYFCYGSMQHLLWPWFEVS